MLMLYHLPQYHLPQDMICYVNVVVSPTTGYDMLC